MSVDASAAASEQQAIQQRVAAKLKRQMNLLAKQLKTRVREYGQDHCWSLSDQEQGQAYCAYLLTPAAAKPEAPDVWDFIRACAHREFQRLDLRFVPYSYTVGQRVVLGQEPLKARFNLKRR